MRLNWLAGFPPGHFAFVMATGIVSIAAHHLALSWIAWPLFLADALAWVLLSAFALLRLLRFPDAMWRDMVHHGTGPSFLTMVAATGVLGAEVRLLTPFASLSLMLWWVAVLLWLGLLYGFFLAMTLAEPKPPIERGLNGAWLLVTVSTESLTVLGTMVADQLPRPEVAIFGCFCLFLLGGMFYAVLISLIMYRWLFFNMTAEMLTPPYWINMGAVAITTLAGAGLMLYAREHAGSLGLLPFLSALTAGFWTTATWWIPLLIALTVWRHAVRHVPLGYDPQYWSMVFPLGMYTTATTIYARASGQDFLLPIARIFVWVALASWLAAFIGLALRILRAARHRTLPPRS